MTTREKRFAGTAEKHWGTGGHPFSYGGFMIEDLRFALRQLRRSPGFAAAVVVTLALAIGVNTAVFSLLDGFLLRTLPYPQPNRIAALVAHEELKSNPAQFEDDDSSDNAAWTALKQDVPAVTAAIAGEGFGDTE